MNLPLITSDFVKLSSLGSCNKCQSIQFKLSIRLDESPNESSDRITHNHRTKWDMIGYHEVTETQSSTGNLLGPSSDESDSCWASDPTGQSCNIPPTKSTVIQIENENTQGNRVLLNTQQSNITQGTRDTNIHNIY